MSLHLVERAYSVLNRFLNVKDPSRGLLRDCKTSNFAKVSFQLWYPPVAGVSSDRAPLPSLKVLTLSLTSPSPSLREGAGEEEGEQEW